MKNAIAAVEAPPTFEDLFGFWESIPEMASEVGVTHWTANKWWQRGRIPQEYWPELVTAAGRKGKKLRTDDLLAMHAKRRRGSSSAARECR